MRHSIAVCALGLAVAIASPGRVHAHHSNVAFEVNKIITITGVVKEFKWANPHTWLYVTVTDDKGATFDWACEGRAPSVLTRAGWSRSSVKPGDTVTVYMSPAKDGTRTSLIARVVKADGTILANSGPAEQP